MQQLHVETTHCIENISSLLLNKGAETQSYATVGCIYDTMPDTSVCNFGEVEHLFELQLASTVLQFHAESDDEILG